MLKTSSSFFAEHQENDAGTQFTYGTSEDLAQSTSFQMLCDSLGNGADESASGSLSLFNPSSTTYVKHFVATIDHYNPSNYQVNSYVAGYGNTTSAINAVQFKMSSGNFDGTILMFGIV